MGSWPEGAVGRPTWPYVRREPAAGRTTRESGPAGPVARVTMPRAGATSVTSSSTRRSPRVRAWVTGFLQRPAALRGGARGENHGAAAGAEAREQRRQRLRARILAQVGAQLDQVGAGGADQRLQVRLAARRDDARRAIGELDRADGEPPRHRSRLSLGVRAVKRAGWTRLPPTP